MSFIRLSNRWINPQWIRQIIIHPSKYCIYCENPTPTGFILAGSGFIQSDNNFIEIRKDNQADYDVMEKWMKNQ